MGSKLNGATLVKIENLDGARTKFDRVRKLVEMAAVNPKSQEDLMRQCHRAATDVGRLLANSGLGALSTYAHDVANAIKRPGTFQNKLGSMRDAIGKVYVAFDSARRELHKTEA